jgi:hypothetical protein
MHNPIGVAGSRMHSRQPFAAVNHVIALWIEEGRTRPSHVMSNFSSRFQPWIKPSKAKPASSQGEALATTESVHNRQLNQTEDMILESLHD